MWLLLTVPDSSITQYTARFLLVCPWGTEQLQVITIIYHLVLILYTQIAAALHLTASGDRQAASIQYWGTTAHLRDQTIYIYSGLQ